MSALAAFFAKPAIKFGAIALAVLLIAGGTWLVLRSEFKKGETAGASGVTNAVQEKTIKELDNARKSKEETDEKVRTTPFELRLDGLR